MVPHPEGMLVIVGTAIGVYVNKSGALTLSL